MDFGLFEDYDDKIESFEISGFNDNFIIFKVRLKDKTEFYLPVDQSDNLMEILDSLTGESSFKFPTSSEDIRVFCEYIIKLMANYYTAKVFRKKMLYIDKEKNEYLDYVLKKGEIKIRGLLQTAARLAPLWVGQRVQGLPAYHGDNPYNIHGVDHKYDYLLKEDQKYFARKRDLILILATSRIPVDISEQQLVECTSLANALKGVSLGDDGTEQHL